MNPNAVSLFNKAERPTIDVSASRDGIDLLGALTEYGEPLFLECNGSFTEEVTVRSLRTLREEFGENPIVVLDRAPYFIVNTVENFVEDAAIDLVRFPTGSPDLNPTKSVATAREDPRKPVLRKSR